MKRDEAISRLRQHEAGLKRLGVEHLYMFGSTARGEATHDSDVDLFFDYQKGKLGVYELMDVDDQIRSLIHGRAAESEIAALAHRAGLKSMREDGERLVAEGITSLEEVVRVTRE